MHAPVIQVKIETSKLLDHPIFFPKVLLSPVKQNGVFDQNPPQYLIDICGEKSTYFIECDSHLG